MHPLDRVGIDVRGRHLDGRRQVDDHLVLRRGLDDVDDGVAHAQGVLELGAGVGLRGVLVGDGRVRDRLLVLLAQQRALHGDVEHGVLVGAEDDVALHDRGGVVEVDDGALGARDRLVGALDEVLAGLGEDLDRHVLGDAVLLDEGAHEVVVRLGGRREADLDLLVAHLHQELEHAQLALGVHGIDEGLVAVAQVDRAPAGGAGDAAGGPGAVGELDPDLLVEGQVLVRRHARGLLGRVARGADDGGRGVGLGGDGRGVCGARGVSHLQVLLAGFAGRRTARQPRQVPGGSGPVAASKQEQRSTHDGHVSTVTQAARGGSRCEQSRGHCACADACLDPQPQRMLRSSPRLPCGP